MADDKMQHWRALADYLGKEMYVISYDAPSDSFRLLPPPGAGLEATAEYRVLCDGEPGASGKPLAIWPFQGKSYRIFQLKGNPLATKR